MSLNLVLKRICEDVVNEMELPENGVYVNSNISLRGKNKGDEISWSICINEPEYPAIPNKEVQLNKSDIIMKIPNNKKEEIELIIKNKVYKSVFQPTGASIKDVIDNFTHVIFSTESDQLYEYIKRIIIYCVENYISRNTFSCCSRFIKCSDAKKCVHDNKLYAKGCSYEKHLRNGEIFYGVNRNVD